MFTLWFAVLVIIMALLVAVRYGRLAWREVTHSPSRILMTGIMLAALGVVANRLYWLPWHWYVATGGDLSTSRIVVISGFWDQFADYHTWGIYLSMTLYVSGMYFHLHVAPALGSHRKAIHGLGLVMLVAAVAPLLAWVWS